MSQNIFLIVLLVAPFVLGAPSEERTSLPPDEFVESYNSTLTEGNVEPEKPQHKELSKASVVSQPQAPQIPIAPIVIPRPFSIPFPFPFPPPPSLPAVFQVIPVPRPQKNVQEDEEEYEIEEEIVFPMEISSDFLQEARRAPLPDKRKKKKQKKQKKQKKKKKQKKQKKQKKPVYPQPIVIYQNQEEALGNEGGQPSMAGTQGAQSSYLGYYMVYVVEVRWTGNNYTQTVLTGRPIPAAITVPPSTESGLVNNLSETISPANLVNGNRPQPTPTCFYRSTTTEHFGNPSEVKPVENTDNPSVVDEIPENQEQIGEEVEEETEELDSVEEEYEDESDPKKRKKKRKGLQSLTSTDSPKP